MSDQLEQEAADEVRKTPASLRTCHRCGALSLGPAQVVLNPRNGRSTRIMRCQCGEVLFEDA